MKKLSLLITMLVALAPFSRAQLVMFEAHLTGASENPPNMSLASGWGMATLDLATDWFVFNDTWSGLSAPATATHIHAAAPIGSNAPVFIPFTLANGFVAGTTSGSVSYSGTLSSTAASQLLDGLFYVNVHSTLFPGGEIRGQLLPVPEPSTYALCGVAALGLLVLRRRFRSSRA